MSNRSGKRNAGSDVKPEDIGPNGSKKQTTSKSTDVPVYSIFAPQSTAKPQATTQVSWREVDNSLLVGTFVPSPLPEKRPIPDNAMTEEQEAEEEEMEKAKDAGVTMKVVAAFDLDGTLIKPKSSRTHSIDGSDWMWWHPSVPNRLRQMYDADRTIVVFSNQAGLSLKESNDASKSKTSSGKTKKSRLAEFKAKCEAMMTELNVPISIYAATERDYYRKPLLGMWYTFLKDNDLPIDDSFDDPFELDAMIRDGTPIFNSIRSFYVGDAAGRAVSEFHKTKDFSSADFGFSGNMGLEFYTPETFFTNKATGPHGECFVARDFLGRQRGDAREWNYVPHPPPILPLPVDNRPGSGRADGVSPPLEIVVFCGSPGSGKSTYFSKNFASHGYERVNQDTLKTRDKCVAAARTALTELKRPVVVDNTNPDRLTRKVWIDLARQLDVPIRCAYFSTPPDICLHNDAVRAWWRHHCGKGIPDPDPPSPYGEGPIDLNPENRSALPKIAFNTFASRFEQPAEDEGFDSIVTVDFYFRGTVAERDIWAFQFV